MTLEAQDRVLRLPVRVGERLAVRARIALVVPAQTVRQALEEERAAAGARRLEVASERVPHGDDVVPVDGVALDLVGRDHVAHALDVRVRRARRELREAVVLADEDERQLPERREVDGLVEVAGLHRAVAEEDDRDRVLALLPRGQGTSERERDVAADDAGRAHEAVLHVDEVHRAAEPAAQPAVAPHQLGHRPLQRRALRDRVTVRAVPGVDGVVVPQLRAHGRGDALLTDAEVDQPVDLVGALELGDPLLEQPDPPHRRQQAQRLLAAERVEDRPCPAPTPSRAPSRAPAARRRRSCPRWA